jgi:hypothetical protein
MTETAAAPDDMAAPQKSRPIWLIVLVVLIVICCCCTALAALTIGLWTFGDQMLGVAGLAGLGVLA